MKRKNQVSHSRHTLAHMLLPSCFPPPPARASELPRLLLLTRAWSLQLQGRAAGVCEDRGGEGNVSEILGLLLTQPLFSGCPEAQLCPLQTPMDKLSLISGHVSPPSLPSRA